MNDNAKNTNLGKNRLASFLFVFAAIGAVAAILMTLNPDTLARRAVEKIATHALGTPVTIGSLHIDLKGKTADIKNLSIASPPNFGDAPALQAADIAVVLGSLEPNLLTIDSIAMEGLVVNLAVRTDGTNLTAVGNQARKNTKQEAAPKHAPPKLIIRDLVMAAGTLNTSFPAATGVEPAAPIALPGLHLKDIGERENGVEAGAAASWILDQVVRTSLQTAGPVGLLKGLSPEIMKDIRTRFEIEEDAGKRLVEQAKEGLHGIGESLKGLLGGDEAPAPAPEAPAAP